MRKKIFIFCTIIILLLAYAWYARASIYWQLGDYQVFAPTDFTSYTIDGNDKNPLIYVAMGDSLTAGVGVDTYRDSYPYRVATAVSEDRKQTVTLIPFAIPGIRSQYAVEHFIEPIIEIKPDIISIYIGINDIHGNVSTEKFGENYEQIVQSLGSSTDAEIYLVNLPYIGTKELVATPYRHYFNWKTKNYNKVIEEIAIKNNVVYVDLYQAHQPFELDTNYYAKDFFHPNKLGYTHWADTIYASFNQ
jgi:lysophospholipase L1-like esterase